MHQIRINGRHYVLLPKLNCAQIQTMTDHFSKAGFSVRGAGSLTARSSACVIHVEPSGVCWSYSDPSDFILPSVPDLLGCSRQGASPDEILGMYLQDSPRGSGVHVRVNSRLESMGNWDRLRVSGECGLGPDEQLVARFLLAEAEGTCQMVTDFAVNNSAVLTCGRRLYFESTLPVREASDTIRAIGERGRRNSYLPRNGVLTLSRPVPSREKVFRLVEELGEWCSFQSDVVRKL